MSLPLKTGEYQGRKEVAMISYLQLVRCREKNKGPVRVTESRRAIRKGKKGEGFKMRREPGCLENARACCAVPDSETSMEKALRLLGGIGVHVGY